MELVPPSDAVQIDSRELFLRLGGEEEWDEATAMVAIVTVASFRRGLDIELDGVFPFSLMNRPPFPREGLMTSMVLRSSIFLFFIFQT